MSSFGAVLDADVLIPAGPRDTLLRAAMAGLYRPYWSEDILVEVERNLADLLQRRGQPDSADAARRLITTLRRQFPEALVENYEALIPVMRNHRKDRHVLAAGVVSQAQAIVTENLRHFPAAALQPYHLEALSPDAFLSDLVDLYPEVMRHIVTEQGADLHPPRTLDKKLDDLARQLPNFVAAVRATGGRVDSGPPPTRQLTTPSSGARSVREQGGSSAKMADTSAHSEHMA